MIYTSLYGSIECADGTFEIILVFLHQKSIHLKSVLFPKFWRQKDRVKFQSSSFMLLITYVFHKLLCQVICSMQRVKEHHYNINSCRSDFNVWFKFCFHDVPKYNSKASKHNAENDSSKYSTKQVYKCWMFFGLFEGRIEPNEELILNKLHVNPFLWYKKNYKDLKKKKPI